MLRECECGVRFFALWLWLSGGLASLRQRQQQLASFFFWCGRACWGTYGDGRRGKQGIGKGVGGRRRRARLTGGAGSWLFFGYYYSILCFNLGCRAFLKQIQILLRFHALADVAVGAVLSGG